MSIPVYKINTACIIVNPNTNSIVIQITTDIEPLNNVEVISLDEDLNLVSRFKLDFLARNSVGSDSGRFLYATIRERNESTLAAIHGNRYG
tara:strand:+ start:661 stop:933 length:273 start_codon:yes stop_codon:yes gene_type:complete